MNKHFYTVPWILCLVVLLGGCGRELQQQQAFESFLQKEVIPRNSGILIPNMSTRKKLGVYALHYDVIVEYNKVVLEKVCKPLEKLQRDYQDAMKPEASVEERRKAIIEHRRAIRALEVALDKELAWTESEIAKLDQPDELRKVYTLAVEKHIRIPAKAFKAMVPANEKMMNKNLDLLDFIAANKGKVEIKDGQIQVDGKKDKDQATLNRLREMQDEIIKMAKAIQTQHNEFTRQLISK